MSIYADIFDMESCCNPADFVDLGDDFTEECGLSKVYRKRCLVCGRLFIKLSQPCEGSVTGSRYAVCGRIADKDQYVFEDAESAVG